MEKDKVQKKKLPLALRLIILPFKIVFILLIIILLWLTFCRFDRISSVNALPPDYALYMRTDNVWNTAEPLMDLDASLVALTSPEFKKYRETFLNLKSSKLRKNFIVQHMLRRRLDLAVYKNPDSETSTFAVVLDTGFLSGITRLSPYYLSYIKKIASKIELCNNSHGIFYQFQKTGYFAIKKNLIVFSNNRDFMSNIMSYENEGLYKVRQLDAMNANLKEPLRILADAKGLANIIPAEGTLKNYINAIEQCLSNDDFTSLNFGITDTDLNLAVNIPLDLDSEKIQAEHKNHPVIKLLKKESKVPLLLPKLTDDIQYYTLIDAGNLYELKEAAIKLLPPEKNFEQSWNKAESASKILFGRNLEEILFSWTGDEFIVFGIEGKSEPVLGIKIVDENLRQQMFNRLFSSFIVQSNDSLLVDGLRLPCIQIPSFFLNVLKSLDINVPKPYYLVKDDFIYFSRSPENLVTINSASSQSAKLSSSENWKRVSSNLTPYSTLSLYYNLERSIPFFIKGNSAFSKVLSLYNSGRFDFKIEEDKLSIQLQASSIKPESSKHIPGFPISLDNKTDAELVKSSDKSKKPNIIFWLENDSSVNSLDCKTFERNKKELSEVKYLISDEDVDNKLWALTKSGIVYLLNYQLEVSASFPILTGATPSCAPFIYKNSLAFCGTDGFIYFVDQKGNISNLDTNIEDPIKSTPAVSGDTIALYEKGFLGGIHIFKNLLKQTDQGPLELEGIAYGSPCIFTSEGNQYTAMITQSGQLYVYDSQNVLLPLFPQTLGGVFYLNVQASGGYIFALSAEGDLYRINLHGNAIKVRIPYFTAKSGRITIFDYNNDGKSEIFISGEGNSLYGFDENLEMLPSFPIPGFGNPVFTDLNGDNKKDCIVITFDNTISAENVLK